MTIQVELGSGVNPLGKFQPRFWTPQGEICIMSA